MNVLFSDSKRESLSELASRKARAEKIPFGEALKLVAREHPELATRNREQALGPDYPQPLNDQKSSASVRLAEMARDRAIREDIRFRDALVLTAIENPDLMERRRREIKEI